MPNFFRDRLPETSFSSGNTAGILLQVPPDTHARNDGDSTGTHERRAHPRFVVQLTGLCSIAGGDDVPCVVRDLSVGGCALQCETATPLGSRVIAALPQIGLIDGRVVRTFGACFALALTARRLQRERVTNYLDWLVRRNSEASFEARAHVRIVPFRRIVALTVGSEITTARIVDVSRSGVALTTTRAVAVGDAVVVGEKAATVVRPLKGGFAANFREELGLAFDASVVF